MVCLTPPPRLLEALFDKDGLREPNCLLVTAGGGQVNDVWLCRNEHGESLAQHTCQLVFPRETQLLESRLHCSLVAQKFDTVADGDGLAHPCPNQYVVALFLLELVREEMTAAHFSIDLQDLVLHP